MNNAHSDEIRLADMLQAMVKHRVMIMILTITGLVIGIVVSFISFALGEISKEYAISSSIAVTSQAQDGLFTTQSSKPNSTDVHLAEDMVDSVIYVLKSDKLLEAAIDRMGLVGIPAQNINTHLTLTQYRGTQIIEMTLYWRSAEEGVRILTAINDVAPSILVETLKIGGVSVVNNPVAKYRVGGGINASLILLITFCGFALGAGISVFWMLFFPTLVNPKDLEALMGLEMLGQIPGNTRFFSKRRSPLSEDMERLGLNIREGYASAAHILANRTKDRPCWLYVTSAQDNEGRTTAAANLALELARQEYRVLLVDFDIRNPSLGTLLLGNISYEDSLNALYRGDADQAQAVHRLNGFLDVLPAVLERRELPMDDTMLSLVKEIGSGYDYVIMDAPPVGQVANTVKLNRLAFGTVLVVRYDTTGMREIQAAVERLEKSGTNILGTIVTDINFLGNPSGKKELSQIWKRKKAKAKKAKKT